MRRLRQRRWAIPTAIGLAIVLVVGIVIARRGPAPAQYVTAPAALGTVTQTVDITGTMQPSAETDLDFGTNGHVATISTAAGEHVTAGQVLASLDPTDARTALLDAQDALRSAQAKLAQDLPGPDNTSQASAQSAVNAAQAQLPPDQADVTDTERAGQRDVEAAQIALQTALASGQGLIASDRQDVTADQAQLTNVQRTDAAAVTAAQASVAQAEADTQANVNQAEASLKTAQTNLSAARANDQAAVNTAQTALNNAQTTVRNDNSTISRDQSTVNSACSSAPTPAPSPSPSPSPSTGSGSTSCTNAQNQLRTDQQKLQTDQQTVTTDQSNLAAAQTKLSADTAQQQAQVNAAEVAVQNARNQQVAEVKAAQTQVLQAQTTEQRDVDAAQAQLNTAVVQLQNAQVAYQSSQVSDTNAIGQAQTHAQQNVDQAVGTLDQANSQLQNTLAELAALQNGQIPQTVVQDQAQIATDQTQVADAQNTLAGTQLTAPIDGTIEQVNIAPGQAIGGTGTAGTGAGALPSSSASGPPTAFNNAQSNVTHAIILTNPNAFEVSGPVSDAQLPQVTVGEEVYVVPAGGENRLLGHVIGVAPSALTTQGVATFTVTALIDGINSNAHAGSTAQMSIVVERDVDVLTVPTSAVHTVGASTYVLVPRAGQEVAQPVTVGASDPERTQITSGLRAGQQVVLAEQGVQPPSAGGTPGGGTPGAGGAGGRGAGAGGGGGGGGGGGR